MNTFLLVIAAAILLVISLRNAVCWSLFRGRKVEREEDLFKKFLFTRPVDFEVFKRVITLVGVCYRISPGKLRPNDSFDDRLAKLDSWNLGCGVEDLEQRLEKELSIRLPAEVQIKTVQQLIEFCANELRHEW